MYYDDAQVQRENEQQIKKKKKIFKLAPYGRGALNVPSKRCSTQIRTWLHFK